jgi:hypothetical protein
MPLTRISSKLITVPSTYPLTGSLNGTASYAVTASYAMNGGSGGGGNIQTGSIANQTILYNVTTSQDNVISGLNLSNNKWGVTVVEEWNSGSIPGDVYYNSCSLLMHFSGSNGSTTMIDSSKNNASITVIGNAQISTAQSKFAGSSLYLDGSGDRLTTPSRAEFGISSGNFTIEGWFYPLTLKNGNCVLSLGTGGSAFYYAFYVGRANGSMVLEVNTAGNWSISTTHTSTTGVISSNNWYHIALVRDGTTLTFYVNGTASGIISSASFGSGTGGTLHIGTYFNNYNNDGSDFYGYIDELRITNGIARYTGSFVTQSAEFYDNLNVTQLQTKYIGLVGGLNDSTVDYGVEKLSDSSLKIRKMTASGQPLSGSGALSSSVDRVYVNVIDYTNVMVTSSFAITSSYAQTLQNTNWTSSSFITNDTTQSIAAFDNSGLPVLVKPTSDNVYLVVQNGIMKWIPIASVAVSILNSVFSENESIIDGLYQSTITSVAFVSSFTSGSI